MTKPKAGAKRGRPPLEFPEPINRPMEEIARAVFRVPPKREEEWAYLQEHKAQQAARREARKQG